LVNATVDMRQSDLCGYEFIEFGGQTQPSPEDAFLGKKYVLRPLLGEFVRFAQERLISQGEDAMANVTDVQGSTDSLACARGG
jgi:hypothetical protein